MRNDNTKNSKKLDPEAACIVRRTHGLQAQIARVAGCGRQYVCDVVNGRKAPSERFLTALVGALMKDAQDRTTLAVVAKYGRRK